MACVLLSQIHKFNFGGGGGGVELKLKEDKRGRGEELCQVINVTLARWHKGGLHVGNLLPVVLDKWGSLGLFIYHSIY